MICTEKNLAQKSWKNEQKRTNMMLVLPNWLKTECLTLDWLQLQCLVLDYIYLVKLHNTLLVLSHSIWKSIGLVSLCFWMDKVRNTLQQEYLLNKVSQYLKKKIAAGVA